MGILSNIPTSFGVEATFFRVRDITINDDKEKVSFSIYGYSSVNSRLNKENAVYTENVEVTYEELGYTTKEDIFELCWNHVKSMDKFKGYVSLDAE